MLDELPLECYGYTEGKIDVGPSYWKIDPSKVEERTFTITGTKQVAHGSIAWESLPVDISVSPALLDLGGTSNTAFGSESEYFTLTPTADATCKQLSNTSLSCLLSPAGQASFKVTTTPAPAFPAFLIRATPSRCKDQDDAVWPGPGVVVDSNWRNLILVESVTNIVEQTELSCDGVNAAGCDAMLRARPVELRLRDTSNLPLQIGEEGSLTWSVFWESINGNGSAGLSSDASCAASSYKSLIELDPIPAGKHAVSDTFYVCADGQPKSIVLRASATLYLSSRDPAGKKHTLDFASLPFNVVFGPELARINLSGPVTIADPPGLVDFSARAVNCDGTPRTDEVLDFTAPNISFSMTDNIPWVTDANGTVHVVGAASAAPPHIITVAAADGRDCQLFLTGP